MTQHPQLNAHDLNHQLVSQTRGKSLLELWVTTFLPDWQTPLIFFPIYLKLLVHVKRKVVPQDSKSDLPLT